MPVRRSQRIRPFVMAVVFLFHTELLSFCGMSNPRMSPADRRLKSALNLWFKGKPEETAEPEPRQDISTMDVGAVSHWLRTLSMGQYISTFEAAAVDGLLLANLTGQDLQDIGIDKGIHRKKILMHRDKLLVEGVKTLSVGDQLLLDREYSVVRGNDATPDPEVQRFAPTILKHMRKEGLDLQVPHEIFIKNVDSVDADLLEQSGILDTLEAINHYVWSHTATVDQDAGGVREEIQADLLQIVRDKSALRERIMRIQGGKKQLAVAISSFCQKVKNKMTDPEKARALAHLNESLENWEEKMLEQANKAALCSQELLQRASARLHSSLPGGSAVQANLDELSQLTEDKERAAEKCKCIYNLADPEVQYALAARNGGLKDMIASVTWLPLDPFFW